VFSGSLLIIATSYEMTRERDAGDIYIGGLDIEEEGQLEDEGLLGTYEMITMLDKPDSGYTVYLVMACEFLLSIERQVCMCVYVCMYVCIYVCMCMYMYFPVR